MAVTRRYRMVVRSGQSLSEMDQAGALVDEAVEALDALQSPLPSREEMAHRHRQSGPSEKPAAIAEGHWVDCLRWVATQATSATGLAPYVQGTSCTTWADELEARS